MTWLLVGAAGALGALSRYGISLAIGVRPFPISTLLVNVTGSFLLGLVLTVGAARWPPQVTTAIAVGFLGAYTTYSTFSWELFALGRADRLAAATAYVALSVIAGVLAAALGYRLGNAMGG